MFVTPEVITLLLLDTLLILLLAVALMVAVQVVLFFDFGKDTPLQYALERRGYLASVIVKFALSFKIGLLFYFIFALDKLSNVIPGAMCAAGVVSANSYGVPLLVVKVVGIYLFGLWLVANGADLQTKDYRYTKFKFRLFLFIFVLALSEYVLEIFYFNALDVSKIVSCCGVLFNPLKSSAAALLLSLPPRVSALMFYLLFIALVVAAFLRRVGLFGLLSLLFLVAAVISLIEFFAPYIYELPTHRCPFCILQPEYHYIGYFLYATLFLGTFLGVKSAFGFYFLDMRPTLRWALFFDGLYVVMVSFYPIFYIMHNGVTLL